MGMGVFFGWLAYRSVDPHVAVRQVLDLMVQRAYGVMSNDVLIAIRCSCSWDTWSSARR
jgi:TRAP-type mannitol/chloroaromatic compound transport system permease large subunit